MTYCHTDVSYFEIQHSCIFSLLGLVVERCTCNAKVASSILAGGIIPVLFFFPLFLFLYHL
ncbi:EC1118_1H13_1607p [Saccharomyces cerevisiae EC1118]|uniref:EC1118_1H13_1607p n=1 Tax=Saccharomyces cerevisiae (strain Lalvin EC1118 / Prise de mousse) TaxID=643680 RepID=C8Z9X7_YEAS8|nr:EC1118_1H13_1607p [Saccharomyces cerevisiae EC1118]